jgi:hypothetical protein
LASSAMRRSCELSGNSALLDNNLLTMFSR